VIPFAHDFPLLGRVQFIQLELREISLQLFYELKLQQELHVQPLKLLEQPKLILVVDSFQLQSLL
jgi:hypothetical protein